MTASIIIYDTEYWTDDGAHKRRWEGLDDAHPLLIQLAAVKLALKPGLPIVGEYTSLVRPRDVNKREVPLTPFFTELTKITQQDVDKKAKELSVVMGEFATFTGESNMYSYGHDMIRTITTSCFIQNLKCPFKASQSYDIRQVFRRAGVPDEVLNSNSSGTLAVGLGLKMDVDYGVHDARYDTMSLVKTAQHLQKTGALKLTCL